MKTKQGEKEILYIDDEEVEAIVEEVIEEEDAFAISYFIPDWSDLENGRRYVTQPYQYWKRKDYSGIEKNSGMPKDYATKMMQDFNWDVYRQDVSASRKVVSDFMFRFDEFLRQNFGLYIYSKTKGSGKTMLSCCIGNEIIQRRGLNVKFISMVEYIQVAKNHEEDDYKNATVLIIDDFGAQDEKHDWVAELTFGLINYRYERQKLTLFTSNLDIDRCSQDDRIISRVDNMAMTIKLPEVPVRKELSTARKMAFMKSLGKAAGL